jgi:hypothetical protein
LNKQKLSVSAVLLVSSLLLASGCARRGMQIMYTPSAAANLQPNAMVSLKVIDNRPAEKLLEKNRVGSVRGSYGIPYAIKDSDPEVVARTVTEATSDGLLQSGVGVVAAGQPKTLIATINDYWMDGFMGYKASITVNYKLVDAAGNQLWTHEVIAGAGGTNAFSGPEATTKRLFEAALKDLATRAGEGFRSPQFVQAVSQ